MKVLITGSNGLLGQKLVDYCITHNVDFVATSVGSNRNSTCPSVRYLELDVTNKGDVSRVIIEVNPTHVIHTAAMTNVDACESEPEKCHELNVAATENIVLACNVNGAHFQLISTDFVFDGEKGNYSEDDEINPLSEYAKSKALAEKVTREQCTSDWSIVRTIIVYGIGNNLSRSNIIVWAKGALETGDPLNIVDDQFRAPTYAEDLAAGCMGVLEQNKTGVFHISGPQTMSIYDIVFRIGKHFGYDNSIINRISSDTLNQAAHRPPKTGFNLSKAYSEINYQPHTLEESLEEMFSD